MLKNFSTLAFAGAMLLGASASGCIIVTDDTGTGDGDGDGDAAETSTGDGDGDATGDGDGDATDTDTAQPLGCGWDAGNGYYECGFEGEDPEGTNPIGCPDGLVDGDACEVTGLPSAGCCDADGNNWYCAEGDVVFLNACE